MSNYSMNEDLLKKFEDLAYSKRRKVGIGFQEANDSVLDGVRDATDFSDVVIVGATESDEFVVKNTLQPEKVLVDMLINRDIDAAVRGSISANKVLPYLKQRLNVKQLYRAALLTTYDNISFFLAPVGIDEGHTVSDRRELALRASHLLMKIGVDPKVGVLSGGRAEDVGRSKIVDITLKEAEELTDSLKSVGINAINYNILLEDAIKCSNFILSPDGVCGNLMFRTLIFLGGGAGHGAPLLGLPYIFVDTSRSGTAFKDAIMLASALCE
jgi:putative methanogen marker protein 4